MAPETRGRKELLAWIDQDPKVRTRSAIAEHLGVKQPAVSAWILRNSRPDAQQRLMLEKLTGGVVRATDWLTAGERRETDDVRPMERATGTDDENT